VRALNSVRAIVSLMQRARPQVAQGRGTVDAFLQASPWLFVWHKWQLVDK